MVNMNRKVELLAPAGNYEAFLAAVNAGADAVYLGGEKYGARAYAQNFTTEEICRGIHTAHFMGKKIYLTVNTLVKDAELEGLYDYLSPFYEAGLDGVIVQDLGVLYYIRNFFPELALHASTQMTLTGPGGSSFLKELGVERVVPARELSLDEIRKLKEETGMEVECFVHGAMCYCYSGQCLFSSILGGRSGNRGRCAQPCRLPYQIEAGTDKPAGVPYPLSLKDMCTLSFLPQLMEAGIDSFKIEGRMKRAEYTAGVTALYRKYIDLYLASGRENYQVEKEDMDRLRSLYIRSEIQTGYYERHNGREMITLQKPSYTGSDEALLARLRASCIKEPDRQPVTMHVTLKTGEPAHLIVTGQEETADVYGDIPEPAQKAPLQAEDVCRQMMKTGQSCVTVQDCTADLAGDVFLPVRALNELRRRGVLAYEQKVIRRYGLSSGRNITEILKNPAKDPRLTWSVKEMPEISNVRHASAEYLTGDSVNSSLPELKRGERTCLKDIVVSTCDQLYAVAEYPCRRIYIESDLYLGQYEQIREYMKNHNDREYYLALPYVLRARDHSYLQKLTDRLSGEGMNMGIQGMLIRNLEEVSYVRNLGGRYLFVPDAGLYCYNVQSLLFWADYCREYTIPYELNRKETGRLVRGGHEIGLTASLVVYSRIPMMVTANCIRKTAGRCGGDLSAGKNAQRNAADSGDIRLRDRYGAAFPVAVNCIHCYNIIYNSVPYSLHGQETGVNKSGADVRRYDFTVESAEVCRQILSGGDFPFEAFTAGHWKRGVE